jgi:lysozyme
MNLEQLSAEIEADEGCVLEVYLDHLGFPTVGVGHLVLESDEEWNKPVGTKVSLERVRVLLRDDLVRTASDCGKLYNDFSKLPEEAQLIIANMMFNMGLPRLSKFKKMKEAVDQRRWNEAAAQMKDSKWYRQVTNRAERLCQRMKALSD